MERVSGGMGKCSGKMNNLPGVARRKCPSAVGMGWRRGLRYTHYNDVVTAPRRVKLQLRYILRMAKGRISVTSRNLPPRALSHSALFLTVFITFGGVCVLFFVFVFVLCGVSL